MWTVVFSYIVVKSFEFTDISDNTDGTSDDCIHECAAEQSPSSGDSESASSRWAPGA